MIPPTIRHRCHCIVCGCHIVTINLWLVLSARSKQTCRATIVYLMMIYGLKRSCLCLFGHRVLLPHIFHQQFYSFMNIAWIILGFRLSFVTTVVNPWRRVGKTLTLDCVWFRRRFVHLSRSLYVLYVCTCSHLVVRCCSRFVLAQRNHSVGFAARALCSLLSSADRWSNFALPILIYDFVSRCSFRAIFSKGRRYFVQLELCDHSFPKLWYHCYATESLIVGVSIKEE